MATVNTARVFVNSCLNLKLGNTKFPGAMPVSLDDTNLALVQGKAEQYTEYVVSSKLDGERFLLGLLEVDGVQHMFLVNRKFEVLYKQVDQLVKNDYFVGSLFDVEIIGSDIILFDCITCCGNHVKHLSYLHRLEIVRAFLHDCRGSEVVPPVPHTVRSNFKTYRVPITPTLVLNVKNVFPFTHVSNVQSQWSNDGLIFTAVARPYEPFRTSETSILKWKPASKISIDFEVLPRNPHFKLSVQWPAAFQQMDGQQSLRLGTQIVSHINTHCTGIVECVWKHNEWCVLGTRQDKVKANTLETGLRTLRSIQSNIMF